MDAVEAASLLLLTEEEARERAAAEAFSLAHCTGRDAAIQELLTLLNVLEIFVVIDRSEPGPSQLGVTFDQDLKVTKVITGQQPPLVGERRGLHLLVDRWSLASLDGARVPYKTLAQAFAAKKGVFRIVFKRNLCERKIFRDQSSSHLGVLLSDRSTIIEHIESESPGAHSGIGHYLGWKVCTVESQRVVEAADLMNRSHQKKIVTVGLAEVACRKKITVRKGPSEKLGVTFTDSLAIQSVLPDSLGARSGFSELRGDWKVSAIKDKAVRSTADLQAQFARCTQAATVHRPDGGPPRPVPLTFTLCPVVSEDMLHDATQAALSKAGKDPADPSAPGASDSMHCREVAVSRKKAAEPTGLTASETLVVEAAQESTPAGRAGIGTLVGWRIVAVDGKPVANRTEYQKELSGKQTFKLTLELDDSNLPSNFVEVHLRDDVELRDLHDAFSRYGEVAEVMHPERIDEIACLDPACPENVSVTSKFCTGCGAKVINTQPPYICHVRFVNVETAQRALAAPPTHLKKFIKLKFYHPGQGGGRAPAPPPGPAPAAPKQSVLAVANCLGFNNGYYLLGVPKDATKEEITKSYREKSRKFHPDRLRNLSANALQEFSEKDRERVQSGEMFKAYSKAYKILTDPDEKKALDAEIDKAIGTYGKKQVMARFPQRGPGGVILEAVPEDPLLDESFADGQAGGGAGGAGQRSCLFAGYSTSANAQGEARRPQYSSGGDGSRGYQGLRAVEVVPKEYNPHQVYDKADKVPEGVGNVRRVSSYTANQTRRTKRRYEYRENDWSGGGGDDDCYQEEYEAWASEPSNKNSRKG